MRSAIRLLILTASVAAGTASAEDRALIMTISDYQGNAALPGVAFDAANAQRILLKLGFATNHVRVAPEEGLTLQGMQGELANLVEQTRDGDRVFVYYSGHGTSYTTNTGTCEQALVSRDLQALSSSTLFDYLKSLRDRASRVVVILDSCFSGGVAVADAAATRSMSRAGHLRPKYFKASDSDDKCSNAVNMAPKVLRGLRGAKSAVNLERNYVYMAAARDNEVAYDDGTKGGIATNALADCLASGAQDTDHSGTVSFGELTACAQARIDSKGSGSDAVQQHLVVAGNDGLPIASAAPTDPGASSNPKATLRDLLAGADARWGVDVQPSLQRLIIQKDSFGLTVTSGRDGYVYVFYVGSDNREFLQLYPAGTGQQQSVRAAVPFAVPQQWRGGGPAGTDDLLVVVTPQSRNLDALFGSARTAPGTYASAGELRAALGVCTAQPGQPCGGPSTRNLVAVVPGSTPTDGYGAALVSIEESAQ